METKNSETSLATQKKVSVKRTLNLPVEKVWKAWTEPESFKKWWGPRDFTCPTCNIDLKQGGKYLACMKSTTDEKEFWSTGTYREIIPLKKLVMSDSFSDNKGNVIPASDLGMPGDWPLELTVTVTFEDAGDGKTRISMDQEGVPEEMHDECVKGWQQCFDKLENI